MGEIGADRGLWQARIGLFLPLLVAAQAQTRLPIAGALVPSEQELHRGLRWLPVVGALLGVLWALVAAACVKIGLAPLPSAALVLVVMVLPGGLLFEKALSRSAELALAAWRLRVARPTDGDERMLAVVSIVTLSIVLRFACLSSVPFSELSSTLIAGAILSRWTLSLVALFAPEDGDDVSGRWLGYLLIACVVAIVVAFCQGLAGLLLMIVAGVAVALLSRRDRAQSAEARMRHAAALALVVEIFTLL